jgi:hypothetical protein
MRAGNQPAFAGAGHVQPDSAAPQPQPQPQPQRLAQAHAAPPAFRPGAVPLQPQAQVLPGQLAHRQGEAIWGFMSCPFGVGEPGGSVGTNSGKSPRRRLERNG